jgi:hypothetical protein
MAHNLTTPITIQNVTRIIALRPEINDDAGFMTIPLEVRTTAGSDLVVGRKVVTVRNGTSDKIVRATPVAGMALEDLVALQTNAASTPTGFTDALAAWAGGGAAAGSKRTALEGALRSMGVIDPTTLAGT